MDRDSEVKVLMKALKLLWAKLDDEECASCVRRKTCQGDEEECIEHHLGEARRILKEDEG